MTLPSAPTKRLRWDSPDGVMAQKIFHGVVSLNSARNTRGVMRVKWKRVADIIARMVPTFPVSERACREHYQAYVGGFDRRRATEEERKLALEIIWIYGGRKFAAARDCYNMATGQSRSVDWIRNVHTAHVGKLKRRQGAFYDKLVVDLWNHKHKRTSDMPCGHPWRRNAFIPGLVSCRFCGLAMPELGFSSD